jgi:hypothetical protein
MPAEPSYSLEARPRPPRRPPGRTDNHWLTVAGVALLLGAAGAVTFLALSTPAPPPVAPQDVTVSVNGSAPPFPVSPQFWGANVGTSSPLPGAFTADAGATPVNYYRWPGGLAGDGMNYTSGILTNSTTGAPGNVTTNLTEFVQWCESFACHAILQLPVEIDQPATAAYYVAYTERVVDFHPSYWELGNEPALWTHFGIPWSQWNASQDQNATPASYSQVVRLYDIAILAVDPSARLVGLGGVGTGASQETAWIQATVAVNGPNLSAVSIHVYPAGTPPSGTATLSEFYANLTGPRSLSVRVPQDRAAILAACPTCTELQLLVTEFGSASSPGSFSPFQSGFPQVPFVAHEIVEGLDLDLAGMYLRQVDTPHGGSWLDTETGVTHPLFELYSQVLPFLGDYVVPTNVTPFDPWVAAVVTELGPAGNLAILLVNGNPTESATVHMTPPLVGGGGVSTTSWNASTVQLGPTFAYVNDTPLWHLPPMSLLLLLPVRSGNSSGVLPQAGPPAGAVGPVASAPVAVARPASEAQPAGSSIAVAKARSISAALPRCRREICSTFTPRGTSIPSARIPSRTSR